MGAIIGACGQAGEWARALLALQDAWARRLSPDTISCNAAIAACEIVGQWEWALHLFGLVDRLGLRKSESSYGAAISACCKGLAWSTAIASLGTAHLHQRDFLRHCSWCLRAGRAMGARLVALKPVLQ